MTDFHKHIQTNKQLRILRQIYATAHARAHIHAYTRTRAYAYTRARNTHNSHARSTCCKYQLTSYWLTWNVKCIKWTKVNWNNLENMAVFSICLSWLHDSTYHKVRTCWYLLTSLQLLQAQLHNSTYHKVRIGVISPDKPSVSYKQSYTTVLTTKLGPVDISWQAFSSFKHNYTTVLSTK